MLASPALELSSSPHRELLLVIWTPPEEMLREDMGGQKGETHEEVITNKLKANGEASIFFSLKNCKLPYSCWTQNVHDGVFLSWWGESFWFQFYLLFFGGQMNPWTGCNFKSLHEHFFFPVLNVCVCLFSFAWPSTNGHMVLSTHSLSKTLSKTLSFRLCFFCLPSPVSGSLLYVKSWELLIPLY